MRKGQAALEFLTTYGWAFLVILVMIAALAYFGILTPNRDGENNYVCVRTCSDIMDDVKHANNEERVVKFSRELVNNGCDKTPFDPGQCVNWREKNICEANPDTPGCICELYSQSSNCLFNNCSKPECIKAHVASCLEWEKESFEKKMVINDYFVGEPRASLCPAGTALRQIRCDCCPVDGPNCCLAFCYTCIKEENFS